MKQVTIQGEPGCFHEEAARRYFGDEPIEIVPCRTFEAQFERMRHEGSLLGIVAIFFINASPLSWPIAIALTLFVYFIEILIDNVCARLNWKQVLDVCWLITLLAGGINILILMSIR